MNEQERFTRYWTLAQPVVARYIGALVPDFRDAEDLLQEVAITCLRNIMNSLGYLLRPFAALAFFA